MPRSPRRSCTSCWRRRASGYAIRLPANAVLERADRPPADAAGGPPAEEADRCSTPASATRRKRWTSRGGWWPRSSGTRASCIPRVGFIVTNLSRPAERVVKFYNGRGTAEQWIKEGKNALELDAAVVPRLPGQPGAAPAVRPGLQPGQLPAQLALPDEVEQWSLTTLREKLVKIGARIVRHGRYVVFQLAEVAVPRALFAEILRRIDGLRLRSPPFPA